MSDTNQEQLLTTLVGEIAEIDRHERPPADLENRLLAAWDAHIAGRESAPPGVSPWGIASGIVAVAAVLLFAITLAVRGRDRGPSLQPPNEPAVAVPAPPIVVAEDKPAADVPQRPASGRRRPASRAREVVDFIPLGPMSPDDLAGSFRIVPVRIGNTPADLLLGEDGMARAIRWRSRR